MGSAQSGSVVCKKRVAGVEVGNARTAELADAIWPPSAEQRLGLVCVGGVYEVTVRVGG